MKFERVEDVDYFENETQFWVSVSDVPEQLRAVCRRIDGENYSDEAFGMGAYYDVPTDSFELMTERPFDTDEICNIFYVDDNGKRHWFRVEIPEDVINQIFAECRKVHAGQMAQYGYEVKECMLFDNQKGFILAENAEANSPFAVWHFSLDRHKRRNYTRGRFFGNRDAAERDFHQRCREYQEFHGVNEVKPSLTERLREAKEAARQAPPTHKPHNRDAR